ncbi:MAG TPA: hypothetical protein VFR94_07000 [Nitrososphaeraceae archaeon]|nr:hypothetical protein [Nitrososphaeraceae archaeon]
MKKNSTIVLSVIGALAIIVVAINPTIQAYAQEEGNTVTATQSNSFTADISQSASQTGGDDTSREGDGVDQSVEQGFCFSVNQQNAAAGNDAANEGSNEINCP